MGVGTTGEKLQSQCLGPGFCRLKRPLVKKIPISQASLLGYLEFLGEVINAAAFNWEIYMFR